MEMFELRYFLAVAQIENLNRASEVISVSSGSLSKAISRLEDELQTPLFFKTGRGIKLTPEGQVLKKKASQILQLEEDAKLELRGHQRGDLKVNISANEILQSHFGLQVARKIHESYPRAQFHFSNRSDEGAINQVRSDESHLALVTSEVPLDLTSKILSVVEFKVAVSKNHPLFKTHGKTKGISLEKILEQPFVIPTLEVLGKISKSESADGWRDDKYPRKIKYKVGGLKVLEQVVRSGSALAYLPDHFIQSAQLESLKVLNCPYTCQQKLRLVAKNPKSLGWLHQMWDQL